MKMKAEYLDELQLCGWGRYKSPIAKFCSPPSRKHKKGELYLKEMAHLKKSVLKIRRR